MFVDEALALDEVPGQVVVLHVIVAIRAFRALAEAKGDTRLARKELTRLERQLSRLADQEHRLHSEMAEKATDHEAVLELDTRLRALQDERLRIEEEWLEAAEVAG